ncbi:alpha/beta hydrolase [Sphingobium yanoikuyae]|uniref:Alpha/beta hydrolase n=1 Tax=Sphingobium yanoikuyae TaxID=13690 RepID=A0A6M4G4Z9_SPHYA|nr:alpha/beta hydrolase [Sphingobium yanoikuyae]QJR02308.1 alpha/beta hydrolase [Sphingobium yanoikuyae]
MIRTIAVEGARLVYEDVGSGDPLLCVHGFGGSRASWEPIWRTITAGRRGLRLDQRGFGESIASAAVDYSHADDLLALMDDAGVARCDLIGFSLGGAVSLQFALDHPERVRRLVLIAPALFGWDWSEAWRSEWRAVTTHARAGDMERARRRWLAHPMFTAAMCNPGHAAIMREEIALFPGRQWVEANGQRPTGSDLERIDILAMPCLLLTGEQDVTDLREIADLLPVLSDQVQRLDYPGCGHMLMLEASNRVAADINRFLATG